MGYTSTGRPNLERGLSPICACGFQPMDTPLLHTARPHPRTYQVHVDEVEKDSKDGD